MRPQELNPQHTQFCGQTTVIKRTPSGPSQVPAYQRFVKIVQCLLTINIQWLPCTVIKFHVVKEAKKDVLYFVQDFEVIFDRG